MRQTQLFATSVVRHQAFTVQGNERRNRGLVLTLCGKWARPSSVVNPEHQEPNCQACKEKAKG